MFVIIKSLPFRVSPMILVLLLSLYTAHAQEDEVINPTNRPQPAFDIDFESTSAQLSDCPLDKVSFELVTGYVYSAPADMLDTQPGTLMLTDCIDMCRNNRSCMAVNYETGLCVLFSSNADMYPGALTTSQFPVFTLYVQKNCYKEAPCDRAWSFERVTDFELDSRFSKRESRVSSRHICAEACLREKQFHCRSATFNNQTGDCRLSDMDRHTTVGTGAFQTAQFSEYLESNCVDDPVRLCEFQKMEGRILKTVDSVHQEVESLEDCKKLCLTSPYRCHSFDYGDTGANVCRLSHHAAATLTHIEEPYLEIPDAATYELSSCYNVTIDCRSGEMIARIQTSKIFNGKIYAKGSPQSCVKDISNSLEFDLDMPYDDVDCNVKRNSPSRYSNDVVIQHHDMIVTSADLGLSVHCQYDLSNKSVSNRVNFTVTGEITPVMEQESIVDSPNVMMRVTDRSGDDIDAASVGDMLQLRFDIIDKNSPYEIFVRDLVAMDGGDSNAITLLDSRGCPVETSIMRALKKIDDTGKLLGAAFDAFKFPTSETVQFRALVTPCLPKCEPVICDVQDFSGQIKKTESYGRKKRSTLTSAYTMQQKIERISPNHIDIVVAPTSPSDKNISNLRRRRNANSNKIPEELVVVQEIKISDKFGFRGKKKASTQKNPSSSNYANNEIYGEESVVLSEEITSGVCINTVGLVVACSIFLILQVFIILTWTVVWQRKRRNKLGEPLSHQTTTESLRQLYDSGYPRRI